MIPQMPFPKMLRVRQDFSAPDAEAITNVPEAVEAAVAGLNLSNTISAGQSVAVTAGSRGIANIRVILKSVVEHLHAIGAAPVLIPAMGSHAGGTAEGQTQLLADYGITEESMGVPIRASMETVVIGETELGIPVHFAKEALEADHVLVVNRVKPHTDFVGEIESGLHKMLLIGLGKRAGAEVYHRAIQRHSFPEIIESVADVVLENCPIAGGIAILENAYDQTAMIEGVRPADFRTREPELLNIARSWMPKLPFDECDLLIVDQIGKNISGTGMDTNVVGRKFNHRAATARDHANCRRILVRSLTEQSHGNASGIGYCEFITSNLLDAMDRGSTYMNCLTSGNVAAGAVPLTFDSDREAINAALYALGLGSDVIKVIRIRDTLHLEHCEISTAFAEDLAKATTVQQTGDAFEWTFDSTGGLQSNL